MADHFSFKWTDFRSSLTQGFHDFLQEEMMVDVTLAAEGKFIQAHKLVLSVCSPYFKTLFKVNPCKHPIVILQDIGYIELSYMLEFMYKGEVGVRHDNLKSFLKLANTLKVKGLEGKNVQIDEYSNNVARVKKKLNKDEIPKDDNTLESLSDESEKTLIRKRKRRSPKLDAVKKSKSETGENISVNISVDDNVCRSEDEDDNPLISLIRGEKVKSGENSKQSEGEGKNNVSFSDWDDGVEPCDFSESAENAKDLEGFFSTVHTEDSEQAPQEDKKSTSPRKPVGPAVTRPKENQQNNLMHLPEQIFSRRRCAVCSEKKKEKRTTIVCSACKIPLCKTCFTPYHL